MTDQELDALVAEKVMNLVPCDAWREANLGSAGGFVYTKADDACAHKRCYPRRAVKTIEGYTGGVPPYSTDIGAVFRDVVPAMLKRHTSFGLDWLGFDGEEWRCIFAWTNTEHDVRRPYAAAADTPARAICLAALQALGEAA